MPPPVLFADTFYWIALLFPRDAFHAAVVSFKRALMAWRGRQKKGADLYL